MLWKVFRLCQGWSSGAWDREHFDVKSLCLYIKRENGEELPVPILETERRAESVGSVDIRLSRHNIIDEIEGFSGLVADRVRERLCQDDFWDAIIREREAERQPFNGEQLPGSLNLDYKKENVEIIVRIRNAEGTGFEHFYSGPQPLSDMIWRGRDRDSCFFVVVQAVSSCARRQDTILNEPSAGPRVCISGRAFRK